MTQRRHDCKAPEPTDWEAVWRRRERRTFTVVGVLVVVALMGFAAAIVRMFA